VNVADTDAVVSVSRRLWRVADAPDPDHIARVVADHALPGVAAALLAARLPESDVAGFLSPCLAQLEDPLAFPGMADAARRLQHALETGETITVFGDYDADGVTAAAILATALGEVGGKVSVFLPHRVDDGYGLTSAALARCLATLPRPTLFVTVDCGIQALAETAALRAAGIDVIVTDHHEPGPILPDVCSVVNPRVAATSRTACLCGAGVAFKLAHAVMKLRRAAGQPIFDLCKVLDLAAIGTVADVVPLVGENRVLVHAGLRRMNPPARRGLRELVRRAMRRSAPVAAGDLAFLVGPRLNAAGRLASADEAYRLLTTCDPDEAQQLAVRLDQLNDLRRQEEDRMVDAACAQLGLADDGVAAGLAAVVVGAPDWHIGVAGIVAARLVERAGCPAAVAVLDADGGGRGSVRAFAPYRAIDALAAAAEALHGWGGHPLAAGFHVKPGCFERFRELFSAACAAQTAGRLMAMSLELDAWLAPADLTPDLHAALARLEPYGAGHPQPLWGLRGTRLSQVKPTSTGAHLQLRVESGGRTFRAVWFGAGRWADALAVATGTLVDVAFRLDIDTYFGDPEICLRIEDIRLHP